MLLWVKLLDGKEFLLYASIYLKMMETERKRERARDDEDDEGEGRRGDEIGRS